MLAEDQRQMRERSGSVVHVSLSIHALPVLTTLKARGEGRVEQRHATVDDLKATARNDIVAEFSSFTLDADAPYGINYRLF